MIRDKENLDFELMDETDATQDAIAAEPTHEVYGRVMTAFSYLPIPVRTEDWSAWIDGQEEGKTGRGPTEAAAIADLLEQLDQAAQDAPARKPAAREDVFAAFRSGAYFGLEVKR